MESSKLKTEIRTKLYYNQFKYKAKVYIPGVSFTYYIGDIDEFINKISKINPFPKYYHVSKNIDNEQINKFLICRNMLPKDKIIHRIQGDHVSFFSNDLTLLHNLKSIDPNLALVEADVGSLDSSCMYFKKPPKYKFRTYFKGKRIPKDFSDSLRSLQSTYSENVLHFSSGLPKVCFMPNQYNPYRYIHSSHFVEYNDEAMISILALFFPTMLGKTFRCEKQPVHR